MASDEKKVTSNEKFSIWNREQRSSKGGPLNSEYYGPAWLIGKADYQHTDEPVVIVVDPGDGSAEGLARVIVSLLELGFIMNEVNS